MTGKPVESDTAWKVGVDAALHRLVVVGHDREHGIGAGGFRPPRQLDGLFRRVRARTRDDTDPAARNVDGGANDEFLFGRRERRGFASGFTDHDGGNSGRDLALAKPRERADVDAARLIEWGRKIRDVACEPGDGDC